MKTLLFAATLVLALMVGGLIYYLPHRQDPARASLVDDSPATPSAPVENVRPVAERPVTTPAAADVAPSEAPIAAPKGPPPSMAEIDSIVARMKSSGDDHARQMLMHEFVATAARMDFHDQLIARDRLDTIKHSYDPPAVVPPAIHSEANADGGAP